ncbi:MAG: hypothetical protein VX899_12370 [Myxococcota bacterium]|nr:hypothetical protein [Myxococcota bacterium]
MPVVLFSLVFGCNDPGPDALDRSNRILRIFRRDTYVSATFCFTQDGYPQCWAEDGSGGDALVAGDYQNERVRHMAFVEMYSEDSQDWVGFNEAGELVANRMDEVGFGRFYPEAGDPTTDRESALMYSGYATCVLTEEGFVECPKYEWVGGFDTVHFAAERGLITGPYGEACAIDASDQLVCAEKDLSDSGLTPATWAPESGLKQVEQIYYGLCGLSWAGEFYCWQRSGSWAMMDAPLADQEYQQLTRFGGDVCVQLESGAFRCFEVSVDGMTQTWESPGPIAVTEAVTVRPVYEGDWKICGIEEGSGQPQCWDQDLNERFDW